MAREYSEDELESAHKVVSAFFQDFVMKGPFSEYLNGVGITSLAVAKTLADQRWSTGVNFIVVVELVSNELQKQGENPDELVLDVHLLKPLPEGMSLPETYKRLKVFSRITGEIFAY